MSFTSLKKICVILLVTILSSSAFAVVGGVPLPASDAVTQSIVNIKLKNGMCSGSLIAPRVVLTAAHCVDVSGEAQVVAFLDGEKTKPCNITTVMETAFAPGAVQDLPLRVHSPDIVLLRLQTPLCDAKTIDISHANSLKTGDKLRGAGHGRGNTKWGEAEYFELQMIEAQNLESLVSPLIDLYKNLLSIGARTYQFALPVKTGSSFCTGDSGGPVYFEKDGMAYQLGVNGAVLPNQDLGSVKCDQGYLQLITPLAPYLSWIERKLLDWKDPASSME